MKTTPETAGKPTREMRQADGLVGMAGINKGTRTLGPEVARLVDLRIVRMMIGNR